MTGAETIGRVRADHRQGKGIRQIARERHLDRNTVRKILRSGEVEFQYVRTRVVMPSLGEYRERLEELLEADAELKRKERRPVSKLYEDLQREGFTGGYDCVRRYARRWQKEREETAGSLIEAYVPLVFRPAEAFQFDWSTEWIVLNGVVTKVSLAHFTLCHSRMVFARFYKREQLEMVLDAHERAFEFFGGTCERGIYDNMKTAVQKILVGKDRAWNRHFLHFCSHHALDHDACTRGAGWEKGRVERGVQRERIDFLRPRPTTNDESLEELNDRLMASIIERARRRPHPEDSQRTVYEVFLEEQKELAPVVPGYESCTEHQRRCSKTCLVSHDGNHYSADCTASGKVVQLYAYADRIRIMHAGRTVADHRRSFGKGKTIFDYRHYLKVLPRKPGALRNGAPFQEGVLPDTLHRTWRVLEGRKRGDREFANILSAVVRHGEEAVIEACRQALAAGTVSETVILNQLHRMQHASQDVVDENISIELSEPPSSDCSDYDQLLSGDP